MSNYALKGSKAIKRVFTDEDTRELIAIVNTNVVFYLS